MTTPSTHRLVTCILFCSIELSHRPFHASPSGTCAIFIFYHRLERGRQDSSFSLMSSQSGMNCSITTMSTELRRSNFEPSEKPFLNHPQLSQLLSERAFWLQRRNSLSSRNAIYPPCLQYSLSGRQGQLLFSSAPQITTDRHWPSSLSSSRHLSFASPLSPLQFVLETSSSIASSSSSVPTRAPSSLSSASTLSEAGSKSPSPLSTMRRASQPEIPIIPNWFLKVSSSGQEQQSQFKRGSSLPSAYAWSPFLCCALLSEDPEIKALSVDAGIGAEGKGGTVVDVDVGDDVPLAPRSALPRRARGHTTHSWR